MIQTAIELHDSTLRGIAEIGTQVVLFLRAYLHQSEGRPAEAAIKGELPEFPSAIWEGIIKVNGEAQSNLSLVPFHITGDIALKMRFMFDTPAEFTVRGKQAVLTLIGTPIYVEEFPGADEHTTA